jgi:hypothetical protein
MLYVGVETADDGTIEISQYQEDEEGRSVVVLVPEQVEAICKWLGEARKEAGLPVRPPTAAAN